MSRITDTERGARIAAAIADQRLAQPDLFDDTAATEQLWLPILDAAHAQLDECASLRIAMRAQ